ncbi:lactonase [Tatumella citrea]|uniref:Lactonase n=1 Tax=Tatumella citrea TaxID=53336 RepID=A0A1Y0LED1_TATCI|nr:lactonase [Tatumella citrea]ARV00173.1 lactonase [Tatumella citrea]
MLAQPAHNLPAQTFLVGSWTGQDTGDLVQKAIYPSQGIYRVRLNSDGSLLPLDVLKLSSPSWIVFSHNHKFAYTTNENDAGSVTALKVGKQGKLSTINQADSLGSQPTHATITLDDKYLIAANYSVAPRNAGITLFPLRADGSLGEAVQHVPFIEGSHIVKDRQDGGHAHSVNITPDGKMLFVADLGADTVHAFSYHADKSQPLTAEPGFDLHFKPGEGPRHMTFSANGKFAYLSTEMSAKVHVYRIDNDKLTEIQVADLTDSTNPDDKGGAGILFSPDHKFLYVGNRRKVNEIVVFKADPTTGKLTLTKRFSSGGIEPRAFAFDKTGQYMIIANVYSNNVVELRRNAETGELTPTAVTLQIGTPTDIKFVN